MGSKIKQAAFGAVIAAALVFGAYNGSQGEIRIGEARQASAVSAHMAHVLKTESQRMAEAAGLGRRIAQAFFATAVAASAAHLNQR